MVLLIREIMRPDFLAVAAERDVASCAKEMVARHEGFVLVVESGQNTGIATEWDFLSKVLAVGRDPARVTIGEIASRPVRSVRADAPTDDVIEEMARLGIRRMVVTDGKATVGVVTEKDVFRAFRAYVDRVSTDIARLQSTSA